MTKIQLDEELYNNGVLLKGSSIYIDRFKNAWDERNDMRKIPSIIIQTGRKYDKIDYDINPLGNTKIKNKDILEFEIQKLVKDFLVKQKDYEIRFGTSGYFKTLSNKSEEIGEKLYKLLLEYIDKN